MRTLLLLRHAHARSNAEGCVSGAPPGDGLSGRGRGQARAAAAAVAAQAPGLGAASRFARARETLLLAAPGVPTVVVPELDEIGFGDFEARPLEDYRAWAWAAAPEAPCPGGGESRAAAAARLASGLALLLARPEPVVVAVSHSMPVRYVLDAADGLAPARRVAPVAHATPHLLTAAAVERAAGLLAAWSGAPAFRDAPNGA